MKISQLDQGTLRVTDEDVVHAMKRIPGYLDITPDDFMEVYQVAYSHAFERLKSAIRAKHVMTKEVITVKENISLIDTAGLMADHNLSGFPVMNAQNKVSGIISEKDFLKPMGVPTQASFMHIILQCLDSNTPGAAHKLKDLSAKDIMSSPPICVETATPILEVARIFESNDINRVPVLDKDSNLTGIIARSDLVQALC